MLLSIILERGAAGRGFLLAAPRFQWVLLIFKINTQAKINLAWV
jgi:hypothetical protein